MIDWEQVQQLESDVGSEDFAEVVAMFIDEVDEAVEPFATDQQFAPDILSATMHFMKGSAYNLGFVAFADYCATSEQLAATGRASDVDLAKVVRLYNESKSAFLADVANYCNYTVAA